jgi:hypothetical protein
LQLSALLASNESTGAEIDNAVSGLESILGIEGYKPAKATTVKRWTLY